MLLKNIRLNKIDQRAGAELSYKFIKAKIQAPAAKTAHPSADLSSGGLATSLKRKFVGRQMLNNTSHDPICFLLPPQSNNI